MQEQTCQLIEKPLTHKQKMEQLKKAAAQQAVIEKNIELETKNAQLQQENLKVEKLNLEIQQINMKNANLQADTMYKLYETCTQMLVNVTEGGKLIPEDLIGQESYMKAGEAHKALVDDYYRFMFQGKGQWDRAQVQEQVKQPQDKPVIQSR